MKPLPQDAVGAYRRSQRATPAPPRLLVVSPYRREHGKTGRSVLLSGMMVAVWAARRSEQICDRLRLTKHYLSHDVRGQSVTVLWRNGVSDRTALLILGRLHHQARIIAASRRVSSGGGTHAVPSLPLHDTARRPASAHLKPGDSR